MDVCLLKSMAIWDVRRHSIWSNLTSGLALFGLCCHTDWHIVRTTLYYIHKRTSKNFSGHKPIDVFGFQRKASFSKPLSNFEIQECVRHSGLENRIDRKSQNCCIVWHHKRKETAQQTTAEIGYKFRCLGL